MSLFEHIDSITDSLCLRAGDLVRRNKGLYLDVAADVFNDLNLTTIKMTKRELFQVNKRTNSVDLPSNNIGVFEVSVMDHKGAIWPMYLNDSIHRDIPQVSAAKNCACENQCGYSLCNLVKGYEAVVSTQSDILPNGNPISFQCVNRVAIGKNGIVYRETQGIQRVFTNGVWTNTILVTTSTEMCQCEIDVNGCICDTEQNEASLCNAFGLPTNDGIPFGGDANSFYGNPNVNTWRYFASSQLQWFGAQCGAYHNHHGFKNIYNIEEGQKKLIFPPHFPFDKVLVRWYYDVDLGDMQIPIIVKQTFMTGLQYFAFEYNEKKQGMANVFGQKYSRQKWGLLLELNKLTMGEMRMILSPPIYVPSYIDHRSRHNGDFRY
jgi:hypothetical protein